jgi:small subunit ribosomal protein S17
MQEKKRYKGVVTSRKMDKTVVVTVTKTMRHPQYEKVVRVDKKFYAHDEKNECEMGQSVQIEETRPLSKLKRFRVVAK